MISKLKLAQNWSVGDLGLQSKVVLSAWTSLPPLYSDEIKQINITTFKLLVSHNKCPPSKKKNIYIYIGQKDFMHIQELKVYEHCFPNIAYAENLRKED